MPDQLAANRANALHSTGPRTPEGKQTSSRNALKHGLAGAQVVIKGEDQSAYDALKAQLIEEHAPANEREAMLVTEIAQNWWRLQRARAMEAQVIEKFGTLECVIDPEAAKAFRTVTRYATAIERNWHKCCKDLETLQHQRQEQEAEGHWEPPAPNGFVSQYLESTPETAPLDGANEPEIDRNPVLQVG